MIGEFGTDGEANAERVIREAVLWRLERRHPNGSSDTMTTNNFRQVATAWLIESRNGRGDKCSIRAIDAKGIAVGIHPARLVPLVKAWIAKHEIPKQETREPERKSIQRVRLRRRKSRTR